MLDLLRTSDKLTKISLNMDFKGDLNWFIQFLPQFNGKAFISHRPITEEIELDASLQGLSARWGHQVYTISIPLGFKNFTIVHLEMLNILVAICTWACQWQGKTVRIFCDNAAVVSVLNSGKTRDLTLAAIDRNIFMETAQVDISLKTVPIMGRINEIADSLSRWNMGAQYQQKFHHLLPVHFLDKNSWKCTRDWLVYITSTGPQGRMSTLTARATSRLNQAFADSTASSYQAEFRIFVGFCCVATISLKALTPLSTLTFLEFLAFNNITYSGLLNHLSAVKHILSSCGVDTSAFNDPRIKLCNKAIMRHRPLNPSIKPIIDVTTLQLIIQSTDNMYMGHIFKAAILLSFFSFVRISNLVPHSISSYDPLKQLSRGDIIFAHPGVHIIIKWSKTLQNKDKIEVLKVPSLGISPLCPVAALKKVLCTTSGLSNSPLLQVKCYTKWVPVSYTRLRKAFTNILKNLNLGATGITFHSLRHSGATLVFNLNVPMQDIQSGTWTSETVWTYITQDHNVSTSVATSFQNLLRT